MLNDWEWEKCDNHEYRLKDTSGQEVAYLIHNFDDRWFCRLIINEFNIRYGATFEGLTNAEEVIWRATLWISDICNQVANSFHHIRDHLPDFNELRMNSIEEIKEFFNVSNN